MNTSRILQEFHKQRQKFASNTQPQESQSIEWSTERLDRIYGLPANRKECLVHRQASKFGYKIGKIITNGVQQIVPACPCCNNLVTTYEIPLSYPTKFTSQVQKPGLLPAQSLIYFLFLKMIIGLLIIRFILCDLYVLHLSAQGRYCYNLHLSKSKQEQCALTFSAINLQSSEDQDKFVVIDLLCIVFTIASLVLLVLFDRQVKKIYNYMLNDHQPPQNSFVKSYKLTQFVTNHEKSQSSSQRGQRMDLQTFMRTVKQPDQKDAVENLVSVNLSFNSSVFQTIDKQRIFHKDSKEMQIQINKKYLEICKYFTTSKDPIFYLTNFTGKISITTSHNNSTTQDNFSIYQRKIKDYFDGQVELQPYHESPTHVNWYENNHLWSSGRINKNLLAMLIFLTFISLVGLQKWKIYQRSSQLTRFRSIFIKIFAILTTFIANRSLSGFIVHLSKKQKYINIRQKRLDLFYSTLVSQFCIIVLLNGIIYFIYPTNKLGDTGLIVKMLGVVGINGVLNNLLSFFIPMLIDKCKGCFSCLQDAQIQGFQKQVNKKYQLNEFMYWQKYIFYIVHVFLVAFYGILISAATPILIVVFICQYWIDKYNLFRRSSLSHQTAQCLSFLYQACFRLVYFAILAFTISHWGWGNEINYDQDTYLSLLKPFNFILALAFSIYFWTRTKVEQNFSNENIQGEQTQNYRQNPYLYYRNQNLIVKTYENQNPITFCRKHKIIKKVPNQVEVSVQSQNGNFIQESQFDKYLDLHAQQMLFPVWNFRQNRYRWIKEADLAEDFDHLQHYGLNQQAKKIDQQGKIIDQI